MRKRRKAERRNPRGGLEVPAPGGYQRDHAETIGAGIVPMVEGHRSWADCSEVEPERRRAHKRRYARADKPEGEG